MKALKALLATGLFLVLLLGIYWLHIRFFRVNVLLYSAVGDGLLAAGLAAALLRWRFFKVLGGFEKVQLCVIWLLLAFSLAIAAPTVIDRSLSFYILEKLQQRGGEIPLARMEEVFTKEYVKEHRLLDIRLTEQQQSGTVAVDDGMVRLTRRGQRTATFSRFFRKHFLPRQRLINGEYTDALVDPFRDSANATARSGE